MRRDDIETEFGLECREEWQYTTVGIESEVWIRGVEQLKCHPWK